ncbi:hypothetical protein D9758_016079 [Tetrapyrgos nigripes]|uniref:Protein-S-isoprenylcysteine O-methyltransferase n=1 Tax=Tetrapyrgos nigripes TaxID=182062 RepID=A0A8H5C2L7_9AGAR|nr:hypothetical protein D9758_016079 [Tetrapyrgos nigripes]
MLAFFVKPLCLIVASVSVWVVWTAPNSAARDDEIAVKEFKLLGVTTGGTNLAKRVPAFTFLLEALLIIIQDFSRVPSPIPVTGHPSLQVFFGTLFLFLAATIRYRCYAEMGRHFTYEVSLLKEHKLITTGPYALVRHPSYTGILFATSGIALIWGAEASCVKSLLEVLMREEELSSWMRIVGMFAVAILGAFIAWVCIVVVVLMGRMKKEDELMKRNFGEEWVEWEKKVPWKLLPGII